ncbi:DUF3365 domain-containing protein [Sulfuricella sp.]|uniref:Tll0287-like domain-containing protein n=1 Tax=Sulfuricella sp. TaxID=2099377 RepID=UPI002C7C490A|nr:DUF3365 domain-containing protein [Sulfuricella sp.]HUX62307.1 DUF3365 domain-containing protein [Sulfuricella sp.]
MNRFVLTAIVAAMLHTSAWSAEAPSPDNIKVVAGGYAKQLRSGLMEQMSKNGPEGGIAACSVKAAQLGAETSTKTGWSVKRVSSKARNPLAMPDAYEQEVLNGFEKEIASGKEDASRYEVVREGGIRYARFMKAVRVEAMCLTCHGGSEVPPNVEQKLSEQYPHDTARGYKVGDLRGALSIKVKLD